MSAIFSSSGTFVGTHPITQTIFCRNKEAVMIVKSYEFLAILLKWPLEISKVAKISKSFNFSDRRYFFCDYFSSLISNLTSESTKILQFSIEVIENVMVKKSKNFSEMTEKFLKLNASNLFKIKNYRFNK